MTNLELKQAITDRAIERLEELYSELMEEAHVGQHDDEDTPELETGEAGHDSESVKLATIRREEAEQVRESIRTMKNYQFEQEHKEVEMLALIKTNKGNFFISKALKPIQIEGEKYFLLAPDAPIYEAMAGLKKGDSFSFNNIEYKIKELA